MKGGRGERRMQRPVEWSVDGTDEWMEGGGDELSDDRPVLLDEHERSIGQW